MSSWGGSWGSAWGSNWGSVATQQPQLGGGDDDLIRRVHHKWDEIEAYQEILASAPIKIQKQAAQIVRPYTTVTSGFTPAIDWTELKSNVADVRRLMDLWRELQAIHDDDEEVILSELF